MEERRTYYDILEVPMEATADDIKRAYRRLVKAVHPDTSTENDATGLFQELQKAYEALIDPRSRAFYDAQLSEARERQRRRAAFALNLLNSHPAMQVMNEPQIMYVLAELSHAAHQALRPMVNLCLVLDRSLSMDGARLQGAQDAAHYLIDQLNPADILSVVVFSDRARVLVDGHTNANRALAKESVSAIQPSGGTELLQGLNAGLEQLRKWRASNTLDHLILLTDGHTYGDESGCLETASIAGREKLGLTLLGLGADWNDQLLDEMAVRSGGHATYVESPDRLTAIFRERFAELTAVVARDVQLTLHMNQAAQLQGVYRLTPDIARCPVNDHIVRLGSLDANRPIRVLVELLVQGKLAGSLRALRVNVNGELMSGEDTAGEIEADVGVELKNEPVNAETPKEIEELVARLAVYKVQEKALSEVERGDHKRATTRLQNLATHLMNFGEVELARVALLEAGELTRTGHLSAEGRKRIRYGTRALPQTIASHKENP